MKEEIRKRDGLLLKCVFGHCLHSESFSVQQTTTSAGATERIKDEKSALQSISNGAPIWRALEMRGQQSARRVIQECVTLRLRYADFATLITDETWSARLECDAKEAASGVQMQSTEAFSEAR